MEVHDFVNVSAKMKMKAPMVITEVVWVVETSLHWESSWDPCATTSCTIFGSERATELGTSPVGVECVGWRQAMYILTSSSIERGQPGCISGHQSIEPQLANVRAGIKTRSREATICLFLRLGHVEINHP